MADYTSNLKTWGATGSEYPDGYSYLEGEQPVDDWDNFIRYNAIEDVGHLIDLTNKRIESGSGTSHPNSPEPAHLSYRNDDERLYHYDSTASSWHGLLKVDGDTLQGTLDAGGNTVKGVGKLELDGVADLGGNDLDDSVGGNTIYDASAGYVPLGVLEQSKVTVSAGSHLSGGGTISLGGSVSVTVDDDFLLNTGDTLSGELVGERDEGARYFTAKNTTSGDRLSVKSETDGDFILVGYDDSSGSWEYGSALEYSPGNGVWTFKSTPTVTGDTIATKPWVNNNADVPNADYADSAGSADSANYADNAGDSDTVDGQHASAFAASGHIHALGDLSNVSASGEGSGNGFDADTVDGKHSDEIETTTGEKSLWYAGI